MKKPQVYVTLVFLALTALAVLFLSGFTHQSIQQDNANAILPETGSKDDQYAIMVGTAPVSTGTFIVASDIGPSSKIDGYLNEIRLLRMDTIIVNALEVQNGTCAKPKIVWESGMPDNLTVLMNQARSKGINVYLGLIISDGCSASFYNDPNKTAVADASKTLVSYVMGKFGTYTNFKGWYIPDEPGLALWDNPSYTYDYYKRIVTNIRNQSSLPIVVSPYLIHTKPIALDVLAKRALDFQNNTGITIQAWQDSVGTDATSLTYNQGLLLRNYLKTIANSIGKDHFWVNNELFDYGTSSSISTGPFYKPTSMTRLINQYQQSADLGSKNIVWTQMHHLGTVMTTSYNADSARLMDSYMAYYAIKPYKLIKPLSYNWTVSPSAPYLDPKNQSLTDSITGDPKSISDPAWVGFKGGKTTVLLKLDSKRNIRWVGFHMLQKADSGIEFADTYKLSCTSDNVNWSVLGQYKLPVSKIDGEYTFANNVALNANCLWLRAELSNSGKWLFLSEVEIVTN